MMFDMYIYMNVLHVFYIFGCLNLSFHNVLHIGMLSRMGPLHLADYIGLDTCLFIVEGWEKDFPNEGAFTVPEILRQKVNNNELGRKTGKGFYHWNGEKRGDPVE